MWSSSIKLRAYSVSNWVPPVHWESFLLPCLWLLLLQYLFCFSPEFLLFPGCIPCAWLFASFLFISLLFSPWPCELYSLQCLVCYLQPTVWVCTQLLWVLSPCSSYCSQISASLLWSFRVSRSFPEPPECFWEYESNIQMIFKTLVLQ